MDKRDSTIVKGIAICLMLFHHLFSSAERYSIFGLTGLIVNSDITMAVATDCNVCVALFALISGYGMMAKYKKLYESKGLSKEMINKNILRDYWSLIKDAMFLIPIMVLCTRLFHFSKTPNVVWGERRLDCLWGMVTNMTGIAGYCHTQWFVSSWWYFKIAIIFVIMFPLLYIFMEKCGTICLLAVSFLVIPYMFRIDFADSVILWRYLPAFILGMIMKEESCVEKLQKLWDGHRGKKIVSILCFCIFLVAFIKLDNKYRLHYIMESLQAALITLISFAALRNIPILNAILYYLGKNSKYIWLIHAYIYLQVITEWLFSLRNIWLIFLTLLMLSLGASIVLSKTCRSLYLLLNRGVGLAHKVKAV